MKKVELKFTKSAIDKAGNILANDSSSDSDINWALEVLSNWRAYHAPAMDNLAKTFKKHIKRISASENTFVAQRLKRTQSIIYKLSRFDGMKLSRMQDIGGLRAVLINLNQVNKLVEIRNNYRSPHEIQKIYNYNDNPKPDGYRGIHLIYKMNYKVTNLIEIQIRTQLQHYWATAVEIIDTSQKTSIKLGKGEKKWKDFFKLLSSAFALKEGTKKLDIHKGLRKASIIKRLQEMMVDLEVIYRLQMISHAFHFIKNKDETGRKGHYSILILDSDKKNVMIRNFSSSDVNEATKEYMQIEAENLKKRNVNVVLVNSGDINKLQKSYPNYFMDTRMLINRLREIERGTF